MTNWDGFFEVIGLVEKGRLPAAKAKWSELDKQFKEEILKFLLFILQNPEEVHTVPTVRMTTKYGDVTLSGELCMCMVRYIPMVSR